MATLKASSVTKTSVRLTSSGAGTAAKTRYWYFKITPGNITDYTSNTSTSGYVDIDELSPGTSYTAQCRYGTDLTALKKWASDGTTTGTYSGGTCTFTTLSPQLLPSGTAKLELISKSSHTLKIKVSGIGSNSSFTRTFYWYLNGVRQTDKTETGVSGTTTSAICEFTGLQPETEYTIEFRYKRTGAEYDTYYKSDSFTTSAAYPTTDSASYDASSIKTTSGTIYLNNITPRNYVRTARFYWYNCTSGASGHKDETIGLSSSGISLSSVSHYVKVNANTKYKFSIQIINPDNIVTYDSGDFYVTTWSDTDDATPTQYVNGNQISMTLFDITPRTYARWARFQVGDTIKAVPLRAGDTSARCEFTDLPFNTEYYIIFAIRNDDGGSNGEGGTRTFYHKEHVITGHPPEYKLSFTTSATSSTISATVTLDAIQTFDVDCTVYLNNDDDSELDATIKAGKPSITKTWNTGIVPATFYIVTLKDNIRKLSWDQRRRTKNNFAWSPSVSSGKEFNIKAGDSNGSTKGSWNDFTKQLSKKCDDYSLAGTYSFTTAVKGNQFKASMFNQAVNAINGLVDMKSGDCKTTMRKVSAGDKIMADAINQLASCLNE